MMLPPEVYFFYQCVDTYDTERSLFIIIAHKMAAQESFVCPPLATEVHSSRVVNKWDFYE